MYQVYKTTNLLNNKYYIGIHCGDIFDNNYYGSGKVIKHALKKYGRDNFSREILSEFNDEELALYFEKSIVGLDCVDDEMSYNLVVGGGRYASGKKHPQYGTSWTQEQKDKLSSALSNREFSKTHKNKIIKYQKERYRSGEHHFCGLEMTDEVKRKISEAHKGKTLTEEHKRKVSENHARLSGKDHPAYGVEVSEERRKIVSEKLKGTRTGKDNPRYGITPSNAKKVYQYDLDGNFIKEWKTITEAKKYFNLSSCSSISQVCKGKTKTCRGYQWSYNKKETIGKTKTKNRKVNQYTLDGKFIQQFTSIKKAGEYLGLKSSSNIGTACKGEIKTSGGFKWEYANKYKC